jgi:tRNA threonylcarbamoyl adenosine modification protein YeaZ
VSDAPRRRCVLALDTASDVASVALLGLGGAAEAGWRVLATRAETVRASHMRRLLLMIEEASEEVGAAPADLGAVVVGTGPGTFTGVRMGVATARAIALSLSVPVIGVSSLGALAAAAAEEDPGAAEGVSVLAPIVDARRGEVFTAAYVRDAVQAQVLGLGGKPATWRRATEVFACPPESLLEELRTRVPGHATDAASLRVVGAVPGLSADRGPSYPEAVHLVMGQEALREPGSRPEGDRVGLWLAGVLREEVAVAAGLEPGTVGSPESVVPLYVRAPDADVHITKMRDPWAS